MIVLAEQQRLTTVLYKHRLQPRSHAGRDDGKSERIRKSMLSVRYENDEYDDDRDGHIDYTIYIYI